MNQVAFDEQLWKLHLYKYYRIPRNIGIAPGKTSWLQEFRRLYYHTPEVKGTVIKQHTDQVLHVSFSHNGQMFATCSKDGFIKVMICDMLKQCKVMFMYQSVTSTAVLDFGVATSLYCISLEFSFGQFLLKRTHVLKREKNLG
jgi:WD40 repeat protein